MPDYQKMYTLLFNAATDALQALEALDLGGPVRSLSVPSSRRRKCISRMTTMSCPAVFWSNSPCGAPHFVNVRLNLTKYSLQTAGFGLK